MKVSVGMGLNVELAIGAKYDRFQPYISIEVDTDSAKSIDEQINEGIEISKLVWSKVSNTMENLTSQELGREVKLGD